MSSKKNPEKTQRKRMSLAMQIFIALILANHSRSAHAEVFGFCSQLY